MPIRQGFRNSPAVINARFKGGSFVIVIPRNQLEIWNGAGKPGGIRKRVEPGGAALLQNNASGIMLERAVRMVQAFVTRAPYLLRGEVGVGRCIEFGPPAVIGVEIILHGISPQVRPLRLDVRKCGNAALIVTEDHCRTSITRVVDCISPDFLPAICCAGAMDSGGKSAGGAAGAAAKVLRLRHKSLQYRMAAREKIRAVAEISGIGISEIGKDMVFDTASVAAAAAPKRSLIVIQDHFEVSTRQR